MSDPIGASAATASGSTLSISDWIETKVSLPGPVVYQWRIWGSAAFTSAINGSNSGAVTTSVDPLSVMICSTSARSEEHTSELQSLMRISYAVFCLKKKRRSEETTQELKSLMVST